MTRIKNKNISHEKAQEAQTKIRMSAHFCVFYAFFWLKFLSA